nr:hypothetical protein [Tanacetum cinerariifolium]
KIPQGYRQSARRLGFSAHRAAPGSGGCAAPAALPRQDERSGSISAYAGSAGGAANQRGQDVQPGVQALPRRCRPRPQGNHDPRDDAALPQRAGRHRY